MREPETLTIKEMVTRYCKRQDATPIDVMDRLDRIRHAFAPVGFMLLQCEVLDSSRLGEYVILPYGGGSTFKEPPQHPISPRGLASDMSVVVAITEAQ